MNSNPGIQNVATIAWDGTTAAAAQLTRFTRFGWVFEVLAALAADVTLKVQAAPASAGNPCVAGAFTDVEDIAICEPALVAGSKAQFIIPAGTPIGTICSGTLHCVPNEFVKLAVSGADAADVRAVLIRQGPMV
jgi:hypothetical protein